MINIVLRLDQIYRSKDLLDQIWKAGTKFQGKPEDLASVLMG